MTCGRVVLKRVLAGTGLRGVSYTFKAPSHLRQLQRIGSILSTSNYRWNSTVVKETNSTSPTPPPVAESTLSAVVTEKSGKSEAINETIKKVPKKVEIPRPAKKEKVEELPASPSNDSISIPRKIKSAQKQRRQQEAPKRYEKSRAQKSLRRVGSETGLAREEFEELIQQAETRLVRAYCVAEAFSFPKLRHLLGNHEYYPFTTLSEDCIHVTSVVDTSNEKRDIFFFMDGTVVTWGLSEDENLRLLEQIKPAEIEPYRDIEEEELDFIQDPKLHTGIMGETLIIGREQDGIESSIYAKLAFSNGIARSTKLAVLEEQLDSYLDSTREIPRILARGNKLPWGRQKTLQKVGELLAFRGELNLHSELVETPDLYWAKPQLEEYYNRISKNLDVAVRITILNKKLDYANELAATLRSHLSEKHGLALEWGIIGLIAIEVVFGIIELIK